MKPRAAVEVAAVCLTAILHFVFYGIRFGRGPFIVVTTLAWTVYLVLRIKRDPGALRDFGLSTHGLGRSAAVALVVLVTGIAVCAMVGSSRGSVRFVAHMIPLALLYPLWGLLQQLLVQAMVVRNLTPVLPVPAVVTIAGALFGVVHLPNVELVVATAVLGAGFTLIFTRWRNIWALGICHGWLGVFFYFWVLGRDPWLEIVAGL